MAAKSAKLEWKNDHELAEAARKSVDQIWHAGLGAFARAQHEGEELYGRLVQEGADVQRRILGTAGDRLGGLSDTMSRMAAGLEKQAAGSLGRLEAVLEDRITWALRRVGVPTRGDIDALNAQIGDLQRTVETIAKEAGAAETKRVSRRAAGGTIRSSAKANGKRGGAATAHA